MTSCNSKFEILFHYSSDNSFWICRSCKAFTVIHLNSMPGEKVLWVHWRCTFYQQRVCNLEAGGIFCCWQHRLMLIINTWVQYISILIYENLSLKIWTGSLVVIVIYMFYISFFFFFFKCDLAVAILWRSVVPKISRLSMLFKQLKLLMIKEKLNTRSRSVEVWTWVYKLDCSLLQVSSLLKQVQSWFLLHYWLLALPLLLQLPLEHCYDASPKVLIGHVRQNLPYWIWRM